MNGRLTKAKLSGIIEAVLFERMTALKRLMCILSALCLLFSLSAVVSADEATLDVSQIPVIEDKEFPLAVDSILMDEAVIADVERLTGDEVRYVIDSQKEALDAAKDPLVTVPPQIITKFPALKFQTKVQCSNDYVYATSTSRGVTSQWMFYTDGRVEKKVSYNYEEVTDTVERLTYIVRNDNNEGLYKSSEDNPEEVPVINISDMLFGMAIAVVLMMLVTVIVRKVRKE